MTSCCSFTLLVCLALYLRAYTLLLLSGVYKMGAWSFRGALRIGWRCITGMGYDDGSML